MMHTSEAKTENQDKLALAKIGIRVAARHLIAAKPEAQLILGVICSMAGNGDLSTVATDVIGAHTEILEKDPTLKADIEDILTLLGLRAKEIDLDKAGELISFLCSVIH